MIENELAEANKGGFLCELRRSKKELLVKIDEKAETLARELKNAMKAPRSQIWRLSSSQTLMVTSILMPLCCFLTILRVQTVHFILAYLSV